MSLERGEWTGLHAGGFLSALAASPRLSEVSDAFSHARDLHKHLELSCLEVHEFIEILHQLVHGLYDYFHGYQSSYQPGRVSSIHSMCSVCVYIYIYIYVYNHTYLYV